MLERINRVDGFLRSAVSSLYQFGAGDGGFSYPDGKSEETEGSSPLVEEYLLCTL